MGEEKKKESRSVSGSSGSGGKHYERSKFGGGSSSQKPSGNGVEKFNNVWHMHCSKGCGWNCTHTFGFHSAFTSNPSSFPAALPASHPYHQKIAKEQQQRFLLPPPNAIPANHTSTGTSSNGFVSLDRSKLLAVCEHHERAVADPTVAAFLSDLKKLLN